MTDPITPSAIEAAAFFTGDCVEGCPRRGDFGAAHDHNEQAAHLWNEALGIDWMSRAELTQAIPPAFTQYIGEKLLAHLRETSGGG